ncbi:MAG TPA: hypothetical protein VFV38_14495, partial [Ktedonobacteraceae bacterium]|nr:hypothetical protein [Ktedonobacteraceae bacterium]
HLEANGSTHSYKLADLGKESQDREQLFADGSMGILRWHNRNAHTFDIIELPLHKEGLSSF